jgi:hypothetical protein
MNKRLKSNNINALRDKKQDLNKTFDKHQKNHFILTSFKSV